ncbi:hypothetical protein Tco_1541625 [Tanacetum coccineum]
MRSLLFIKNQTKPFNEAWERFKGLLRQCPHHGFRKLHQLDTFYNSLNSNDQDALDSAAGGNFWTNASRSRFSRDKMTIKMNKMLNEMKALVVTPAPVKAVEEVCVTSSTSNSGTLPSQTVTNPRQQINAITTRSGKALEEPSIPLVPSPDVLKPQKEPGKKNQNPSRQRNKEQIQIGNTAHVHLSGEEDSIFIEIPKTKAKGKPVPEKLEDPGKFLIPCALQELKRTSRPFSFDAKALIDLYEEKLTLRVGKEELVYYADKFEKNKDKNFVHAISIIDFSKDDPFSGSTTTHSDDPSPSSSPVKTSDNFEKFADELAPLDSLPPVISDHEPEHNESSITFSPRSDPLHHEFAGEPLTLPVRNDREFEEYLSLVTVLYEISTSQGNVHQNSVIESLPISPIPVEDSEPTQEEIDILLVPDDLILHGLEDDDFEEEVNELPNLDHQDDQSIPRPLPEPPDIKKCFKPEAGILIIKEFKGVSKSHDFMTGILPTLPTLVSDLTFISSFVSFENEDTIFDPGIST